MNAKTDERRERLLREMKLKVQREREVQPKVLRYGVIRDRCIVDEHQVPRGSSIFVDTASDPVRFFHGPAATSAGEAVFEWTGSGYCLNFRRESAGRIQLERKGGVKELNAFVQEGTAERREDGLCMLRLPEEARGKVVIRDATIMFQFVVPPQPRPVKKVPFMQRLARSLGL